MLASPLLREIRVQGSPRERGRQQGAALRNELHAFLVDGLARINPLRDAPLDRAQLTPFLEAHAAAIEAATPALAEELRGLAEGAGIDWLDACLLQLRREAIGHDFAVVAGDCSTFALHCPERGPLIAQTVDLQARMNELAMVLRVAAEGDAPEAVLYTFHGLLGYLGINGAGIAVGINMVVSEGWRPGVPPYLLVRHLLAQRSLDACLKELARIPRASSRSLTLADRERVLQVEMTSDQLEVTEGTTLLHTNHFLHPELQLADRSHILVRRSSRLRLERLTDLVTAHGERPWTPQAVFTVLGDHTNGGNAICQHGDISPRQFSTVAGVALYPRLGELHVRSGNPCTGAPQVFTLGEAG